MPPARPRHGLSLIFLGLAVFVVYAGTTVADVALPGIRAELPASATQLQWVVNVYILASACLLLTGGALGDILGRKRVFLVGLAGFGGASAVCAMAGSIELLLVGRAVQGAFGSVLIPVSLALVSALFPDPAARARAIGVGAGFCGLALGMGPVLGGLVADAWGWRWIFWIDVPVAFASLAALVRTLPDGQPRLVRRLDPVGQGLFIVAVGATVHGLVRGEALGWGSLPVTGSFLLAAAALPAFLYWERRSPEPMLPLTLFRNPVFTAACAVNLLSLFGLYAGMALLGLRMYAVEGFGPAQTGVRFLVLNGAITVASYAAAVLVVRTGPKWPIVAGTGCSAVGLLGLALLDGDAGYGDYWWLLILMGTGVSLAGAPATVALLGAVPVTWAGTASGVSNTFRQLGSALGVAVSTALLAGGVNGALPEALDRTPLTPAERDRVLEAAAHGDLMAAASLPDPAAAEHAAGAVHAAFAHGAAPPLLLSATGAALAGLLTLVLLRRPRPSTEDLTVRIPVEGEDEIARLSRSFNAMTAALASSRDRQAQLIA
ncbi:MFS transporter, partial [Streptomyces ficellus]